MDKIISMSKFKKRWKHDIKSEMFVVQPKSAKKRRDEAAQDSTREWEVVQGGLWGSWREATPIAARERGHRRANVAASNPAIVEQPHDQLDLVALVVVLKQRLEA